MESAVANKVSLCALLLSSLVVSQSANAVTVSVDGHLTDMIAASAGPYNSTSGSESGADAENNGFDITNMYAHYDKTSDTFYLGMSMQGQVGTSGGDEGFCYSCFPGPVGTPGVFDENETYGFGLNVDGVQAFDLRLIGDSGTGGENIALGSPINPHGATYSWAVSEAFNGVEFSLTGLASVMDPFWLSNNPADVDIFFYAGSISNLGPEDMAQLNMQVVPVPAAIWLFGSGLLGLVAAARRKN